VDTSAAEDKVMAGPLDTPGSARPFADLPAGLVEEVLAGATQVAVTSR